MPRIPIFIEVKEADGDVVASASVTVKSRATGINSVLYNAEVAGSIIANPTIADALGRVSVWVDPDNFTLTVSGTGITTYDIPYDGTVPDGSITTVKLPDGTVTVPKLSLTGAQAWQTLTLVAGGVVTGGPMQYYKDGAGIVHVGGGMSFGTTIPATTTITTLPAGYRPGINLTFPVTLESGAAPTTIKIFSSGIMQTVTAAPLNASTFYWFNNIHYRAEL
jgi:hypothetical protein